MISLAIVCLLNACVVLGAEQESDKPEATDSGGVSSFEGHIYAAQKSIDRIEVEQARFHLRAARKESEKLDKASAEARELLVRSLFLRVGDGSSAQFTPLWGKGIDSVLKDAKALEDFPCAKRARAQALGLQGGIYRHKHDFNSAIEACSEAATLMADWEKCLTPESHPLQKNIAVANQAHFVADEGKCYIFAGSYVIALKRYPAALALYARAIQSAPGDDRDWLEVRHAMTLMDYSVLLARVERVREALSHGAKAAKRLEQRLKTGQAGMAEQKKIGLAIQNFGGLLVQAGKYSEGEVYIRQALKVFEKNAKLGTYAAAGYSLLGDIFRARREFEKAIQSYQKSIGFHQPTNFKMVGRTQSDLGNTYFTMYQTSKAKEWFFRALSTMRKAYPAELFPKSHEDVGRATLDLARAHEVLGEDEQAERLYTQSIAIFENMGPNGGLRLSKALNNYAAFLMSRDLLRAKHYLHRSYKLREQIYGSRDERISHLRLGVAAANYGAILSDLGEFSQCEELYRTGLSLLEKVYPKSSHPLGNANLAAVQRNLATLLEKRDALDEARDLLEKALATHLKLIKNSYLMQSTIARDLARVTFNQGDMDAHKKYLQLARDCAEKCKPTQNEKQQKLLQLDLNLDLADYAAVSRQFAEAGKILEKAKEALEWLRQHRVNVAKAEEVYLSSLAMLLFDQGKVDESISTSLQLDDLVHRRLTRQLGLMNDAQGWNLVSDAKMPLFTMLSFTEHADASQVYQRLLRRRGMLHRLGRQRRLAAQKISDAEHKAVYEQLTGVNKRLSRLLFARPQGDPVLRQRQIDSLLKKKTELTKTIAAATPEFAQRMTPANLKNLQAALPDGAVVIDVVHYGKYPQDRVGTATLVPHLAAFVVAKDGAVQRVELGLSDRINDACMQWYADIVAGKPSGQRADVAKFVWRALEATIPSGTTSIYVAADGFLGAVPWEALPAKDGGILLEKYAFAYPPSAAFLMDPDSRSHNKQDILVAGDIDYGGAMKPLPYAAQETTEIAKRIGASAVLRGKEANEERLLAELSRSRLAHVATHGFYADSQLRSQLGLDSELLRENSPYGDLSAISTRNPLILCGLHVAPANAFSQSDPFASVVSGETISMQPFAGLDLAVLSSCQSGVGMQLTGDGVRALQTAFHVAGANNVIASRWRVYDAATAALMTRFHKHWRAGLAPIFALRQAKLDLYHNPSLIDAARSKGAAASGFKLAASNPRSEQQRGFDRQGSPAKPTRRQATIVDFAGFFLSGRGRVPFTPPLTEKTASQ